MRLHPLFLPLLLAAACASGRPADWTLLTLNLSGGEQPVVGASCVLNVEVVAPGGRSLGVLTHPVDAGLPLQDLAQSLTDALAARFPDAQPQLAGNTAIQLAPGYHFGTVSRALSSRPRTDPLGGRLELERCVQESGS